MNNLEKDFHRLFDMNYYVDISGLPEYVTGSRNGNHVEFIYKHAGNLKRATLSHFPHLGYVLEDLEIRTVEAKQKKVTVYE